MNCFTIPQPRRNALHFTHLFSLDFFVSKKSEEVTIGTVLNDQTERVMKSQASQHTDNVDVLADCLHQIDFVQKFRFGETFGVHYNVQIQKQMRIIPYLIAPSMYALKPHLDIIRFFYRFREISDITVFKIKLRDILNCSELEVLRYFKFALR